MQIYTRMFLEKKVKISGTNYYGKGDCIMPYHKDKQQAFQAAQQGVTQAENAFNNIVKK